MNTAPPTGAPWPSCTITGHSGLTSSGRPCGSRRASGAVLTCETYVPYSIWSTLPAATSAFR